MSAPEFPLRRFPSLAVDEVIKVMDPLEQLALCQTSQKLQLSVRRLTKKLAFHIVGSQESVSLGYGPLKSSPVTICKHHPADGTWHYDVPKVCYKGQVEAVEGVAEVVKDNFAPKRLTLHLTSFDTIVVHQRADAHNIMLKTWCPDLGTTYSLTDNQEVPTVDATDSPTQLSIVDASWLTHEDSMKLFNIQQVQLTRTSFTTAELNQFCEAFIEKWVNGEANLIKLELRTPGNIWIEVAGAQRIYELSMRHSRILFFSPFICYMVERADGKRLHMGCRNNQFLLSVE